MPEIPKDKVRVKEREREREGEREREREEGGGGGRGNRESGRRSKSDMMSYLQYNTLYRKSGYLCG